LEERWLPSSYPITEFPVPTPGSYTQVITSGPDHNLWFTESQGNNIGRITPAGAITEFPASGGPTGITAGPDGNLWYAELSGNNIGRITTAGAITEFPITTAGGGPLWIVGGPDGNLWFTEVQANKIGRITPAGVVTEFAIPTANSGTEILTAGPDGNLWFTETNANLIGRITPAGVVTEFTLPIGQTGPLAITTGPDGNLWYTDVGSNQIGVMTTAGTSVNAFTIPTSGSEPLGITTGADGNLWFGEFQGGQIGQVTPAGAITEFPTPTPGSGPKDITAGPDGNIWFAETTANQIGKLVIPLGATGRTVNLTEGKASPTVVATFTDGDPTATTADFKVHINWGDGTTSMGQVTQPGGPGTPFQVTGKHAYLEEGMDAVVISIQDMPDNSTVQANGTAVVADAKLKGTGMTLTATAGVLFSGAVASFADLDPNGAIGDYKVTILWGDGTSSPGTVTQPGGAGTPFTVSGSHTYNSPGTFPLTVKIRDAGGSQTTPKGMANVSAAGSGSPDLATLTALDLVLADADPLGSPGSTKGHAHKGR
jgi:virginiamycin B lyase